MKEYKFKINGNDYKVGVEKIENGTAKVLVNGTSYNVELDENMGPKAVKPVHVAPATYQATPQAAPAKVEPAPAASGNATPLKSPLPGVILDVKVKEGDTVTAGQTVMILEAMKMENNIDAPKAGVVKSINKSQGDSVMEGDTLLIIE